MFGGQQEQKKCKKDFFEKKFEHFIHVYETLFQICLKRF